ncbi:MAG: hypothetical protein K0S71_2001 [Clostridia bacterium]|jgi:hypothetical protein|nr:hypothetical protein [Clostridia bacterium]
MSYCNENISIEASVEYPLYESKKGRYFIGQTPFLAAQTEHTLAALVNPKKSNKNIYVNAMTITNVSSASISAEFYLGSTFHNGTISNLVSCTNTAICPEPIPIGQIKYLPTSTEPPTYGVPIFSRIVPPYSTLVVDGGQIILGPRESILIYLGGFLPAASNSTKLAFGWWEEKFC